MQKLSGQANIISRFFSPIMCITQFLVNRMFYNLQQYVPSYVNVNMDSKELVVWYVKRQTTPTLGTDGKFAPSPPPNKFVYSAQSIKAVSASKRDDRAAYLYVYDNSDDFSFFFPTELHCKKYRLFLPIENSRDFVLNCSRNWEHYACM